MAHGRSWKILAATYLFICLAVLDYAYVQGNEPGTQIVVGLVMMVLTFPAGAAFGAFLGTIAYWVARYSDSMFPNDPATNALLVALFGIVGYIQWFVVVPRLWRRPR